MFSKKRLRFLSMEGGAGGNGGETMGSSLQHAGVSWVWARAPETGVCGGQGEGTGGDKEGPVCG